MRETSSSSSVPRHRAGTKSKGEARRVRCSLVSARSFSTIALGVPASLLLASCLLTIDESRIPGEGGGGTASSTGGSGGGCDASRPGLVFCDDFETDDLARWDDTDGNLAPQHEVVVDPGAFDRAANHVGVLRGRADLTKVLPSSARRLFVRWYARFDAFYDFGGSSFHAGFLAGARSFIGADETPPDGTNVYNAYLGQRFERDLRTTSRYAGMYQQTCPSPCGSDSFPCLPGGDVRCTVPAHEQTGAPPALVGARWFCFELSLDAGTPSDGTVADGYVETWLDDAPIGKWDGLWMRSSATLLPSYLWVSAGGVTEDAAGTVLVDDVIVATERIGCD